MLFQHFLMFQVGTSNYMFVKPARSREFSAAPPSTTHGGRCQSTCLTQQVRPPHFVMFCLTMNFLVSFFGKQDITSTQWCLLENFQLLFFFEKHKSWKFSNRMMMKIHWTSWCKRHRKMVELGRKVGVCILCPLHFFFGEGGPEVPSLSKIGMGVLASPWLVYA